MVGSFIGKTQIVRMGWGTGSPFKYLTLTCDPVIHEYPGAAAAGRLCIHPGLALQYLSDHFYDSIR